jgi:hypothetical protein
LLGTIDVVGLSFAACGVVGEIVTTDASVQFAITTVCVALALRVKDPTARIDGTFKGPRWSQRYTAEWRRRIRHAVDRCGETPLLIVFTSAKQV